MKKSPEFRVGNVRIRPYYNGVLELTVTVDDVPAVALLEAGEALMLAGAIRGMVHNSGGASARLDGALAELLLGGGESGQPAYV